MRWKKHRKFCHICVGCAWILIALSLDMDKFVESIEYYKASPHLLLIPVGIAIFAGMVGWFFLQVTKGNPIRPKLWGHGLVAVGLLIPAGFCLFMAVKLFLYERSGMEMVVAGHIEPDYGRYMKYIFGLLFMIFSVYSFVGWREFVKDLRLWKKGGKHKKM